MTDSMNFGPEWLRNLSSDGSTTGGTGGGTRYQLSGYRYGREEMLGLYEKGFKPPASLFSLTTLYSEQPLTPLVLTTEEDRTWPSRTPMMNNAMRGGRGASLERGGRISRGRGSYQSYGRNVGSYESGGGWGNGEQSDWSPRKDYNYRSSSVDNWRRNRSEEDDDWRSNHPNRGPSDKWGRSTSWRDGDKIDERGGGGGGGPQDRPRNWHENSRGHGQRRGWDEDLPEWANENLGEGGGTFDSSGAYHGSDEEREQKRLTPNKKDTLQKSSSQHNISPKQPPLTTSKSAVALSKQREIERPDDERREPSSPPPLSKVNHQDVRELRKQDPAEKQKSETDKISKAATEAKVKSNSKHVTEKRDRDRDHEDPPSNAIETTNSNNSNNNNNNSQHNGIILNTPGSTRRVEEDFDRLQEDLVSKLVVEEESPKGPPLNSNMNIPSVGTTTQPPPNLVPPIHDQWYYQDPQGDLQGPFVSTEMAEWFKAGYFSNSLRVRRQCDNSFYTLGDLVRICNGNPFLTTVRIPPLKETAKIPEQELLNLHLLQAQLALRHVPPRGYKPDWTSLSALQQRDLLSQHMLTPQMSPVDLQYLQQTVPPPTATNPLMHIINQMQQANKLPGQPIGEQQQPNSIPVQLDPLQALVQQMHSLQRIQPPVSGIPGIGIPPNMQNENLVNNLSGLHGTLPVPGMAAANLSGLNAPPVIPTPLPPKPPSMDPLANSADNDPINSLLRQLQNKQLQQTQQIDTLWQQNQYVQAQANNQWQQQQPPPNAQPPPPPPQQAPPSITPTSQPIPPTPELPLSMWEIQQPATNANSTDSSPPQENHAEKEQPQQIIPPSKDKDDKKKKEQDEKQQAKKEAEEKKKQEQKRLEQEKKAAEEKRRKEEEKRKKEEEKLKKLLEKAKKEAEEKRQKELEEKRRLKELRKSEEEAKKKAEEQRKLESEQQERERKEQKQPELAVKQNHDSSKMAKAAPWSQSNVSSGPSLADIQKAEREKRAEQVLLQQQQQRAQQQQTLEQQTIEKPSSMQLSWANKPVQPRQVKSLAEIQAEEHERLAKQAAESRLAQQQKEKETGSTISAGIWHGQNLTWANNPSTQWSSAAAGFWDDSSSHQQHHHHHHQQQQQQQQQHHHQTSVHKPSSVTKSNSTSAMTAAVVKQQTNKQTKVKTKKEETAVPIKTSNGPATEEFTAWCTKALANINSIVDIPTFVGFLRDIESAADVKEYCREYLGDNPATHFFAGQFLEKRRSFRPKAIAHKDDMCSPAPAITPNSQHNSDFQEVKGKGKKPKKSKMTKVDASRILGFSVTAAQDRINVGDRDYGENS